METAEVLESWSGRMKKSHPNFEPVAYILEAPSKHLRGAAAVALGRDLGLDPLGEDCAAVIVSAELIHSASLIIDDLPEMDDAMLRRGRKTHHLVFGRGVTILTAVDMISMAFRETLKIKGLTERLSETLSSLVLGQYMDIAQKETGMDAVLNIHRNKTGSLFSYVLAGTALAGGYDGKEVSVMEETGCLLGMAFQLADDLLDRLSSREETGKDTGKDAARYSHSDDVSRVRELITSKFKEARELSQSLDMDLTYLNQYMEKMESLVDGRV